MLKKYVKKSSGGYFFLVIFIVGVLLNAASLGGVKSAVNYLSRNFYFLFIPGLSFIFEKNKTREKMEYILIASLFLGVIKSIYNFKVNYNFEYNKFLRLESFFSIMRWGSVLMFVMLFLLPKLFDKKIDVKIKIILRIIWALGLFSLVLNNSRGPWLALFIGVLFYLIVYNKKILVSSIFLIIISFLCLKTTHENGYNLFKNKIYSISDTKSNYSNKGRLEMWKRNLEFASYNFREDKRTFFLGTGFRNFEGIFKTYIKNIGLYEEVQINTKNNFSFSDSHNSYLMVLNQMGIIYFMMFWGYLTYSLYKLFLESLEKEDDTIKGVLLASVGFLVCGIFYGYIFTYEMFTYFILLYMYILIPKQDSLKNKVKNIEIIYKERKI